MTVILKWVEEKAKQVCQNCGGKCCSSRMHIIGPLEEKSIDLFREHGIQTYTLKQLDSQSVHEWLACYPRLDCRIRGKNGERINEPAIIQSKLAKTYSDGKKIKCSFAWFEKAYYLYSRGPCPLLTCDGKCVVHDDPRRPEACSTYPVQLHRTEERVQIRFYKNCRPFQDPKVRDDLRILLTGTEYALAD